MRQHILSSTLLFGTGLGSAFYMFFASRTRDPRVIATVVKYVVVADWLFTTPTIVLQPLSLAQGAALNGTALPELYWKYLRAWVALGVVAFVALVAVFYLMVMKPA